MTAINVMHITLLYTEYVVHNETCQCTWLTDLRCCLYERTQNIICKKVFDMIKMVEYVCRVPKCFNPMKHKQGFWMFTYSGKLFLIFLNLSSPSFEIQVQWSWLNKKRFKTPSFKRLYSAPQKKFQKGVLLYFIHWDWEDIITVNTNVLHYVIVIM
jgi:hypothetical protein